MKAAIAAEGKSVDSPVSSRGGRAPFYLIFDDGELEEVVKNPFAVGGGGAGWSVAYLLAEKGVDVVVAGRFGPNMETALEEKGLKAVEISGVSVEEALGSLE